VENCDLPRVFVFVSDSVFETVGVIEFNCDVADERITDTQVGFPRDPSGHISTDIATITVDFDLANLVAVVDHREDVTIAAARIQGHSVIIEAINMLGEVMFEIGDSDAHAFKDFDGGSDFGFALDNVLSDLHLSFLFIDLLMKNILFRFYQSAYLRPHSFGCVNVAELVNLQPLMRLVCSMLEVIETV
jgi:hypothetical protein